MRTVTAIKPKGRTQRWTVHVDGRPFAVVDADLRVKHSLHVDEPITDEACAALLADAARLEAWDRASRMLAARGRAAKDLERRLVEKGTRAKDAKEAVERLSRTGLVDDARFAATGYDFQELLVALALSEGFRTVAASDAQEAP